MAYLDDMPVPVGGYVRCKSALCGARLTPGRVYLVHASQVDGLAAKTVCDDAGQMIVPSARFARA